MFDHDDFTQYQREVLDYLYDWEREARQDFSFYALNQWPDEDTETLKEQGRPALVFDRTRPLMDAVAGTEITGRYEAKFLPRDPHTNEPDQRFSEAASKIYKYARQRANMEHHISAAFHSAVLCGVGCTETYVDYESDPEGMIVTKRIPVFEIGWDPSSVDPNLADARYLVRDRWLDEDEIASMFGEDVVDDIIALSGRDPAGPKAGGIVGRLASRDVDDSFKAYAEKKGRRYYDKRSKRIRLWECQRFERQYMGRVFMPDGFAEAAQVIGIGGGEQEQLIPMSDLDESVSELREILDGINSQLPSEVEPLGGIQVVENFPVKTYHRSYHAGHEVLKQDKLPTNRFTYEFITCFEDWHEEDRRYHFGLMRPMRDPQKYANKFFSHAVHMWASNPKGLLIHEESLFEDPQRMATEWGKANGSIAVPDGALSQAAKPRYEVVENKVSFRGIETLLQHALNSVSQSTGLSSPYFVGGATDLKRTAASSIESVRDANLTTVSIPFDSLRHFKKRHALLVMANVDKFMQPNQIRRVLNQDEMMVAEILHGDDLTNQYDIIVEEVPSSQSRQMEVFEKLMQNSFIPQLVELGVGIPPSLAKFFPLPSDSKAEFEKMLGDANTLIEKKMELEILALEIEKLRLMAEVQGVAPPQPPGGGEGGGPTGDPAAGGSQTAPPVVQ